MVTKPGAAALGIGCQKRVASGCDSAKMLRFCPLPHIAQKSIGYRSNHAATRLAGTLASASQSVCCQCSNILSVVKRRMAARAFSPSRMRNAPSEQSLRSEEHTYEL